MPVFETGYSNRGAADGRWSWVSGAVSDSDYANWVQGFTGKILIVLALQLI